MFYYMNKVVCSPRFARTALQSRIINRNFHQFRSEKINQHKDEIYVYTHTLGRIKSRWFLIENGKKVKFDVEFSNSALDRFSPSSILRVRRLQSHIQELTEGFLTFRKNITISLRANKTFFSCIYDFFNAINLFQQ